MNNFFTIGENNSLMDPYSTINEGVEKHAEQALAIYQIALQGINNGIEGVIPDPIVGDQGCQIRAYKFALIAKDPAFREELLYTKEVIQDQIAKVEDVVNQIELLKKQKKESTSKLKSTTKKKSEPIAKEECTEPIQTIRAAFSKGIKELEETFPQSPPFSENVLFQIYSYILSCVKSERVEEKESGEKIGHDDTVSANLDKVHKLAKKEANHIVAVSQRELAKLSVIFMQREAEICRSPEKNILKAMVSHAKMVPHPYHEAHLEMPCFYYSRLIFQRAVEEHVLILLKIRNYKGNPFKSEDYAAKALFAPTQKGGGYELIEAAQVDPLSPAIVMECRTNQSNEMIQSEHYIPMLLEKTGGIISIIEHLVAQHMQYTDQKNIGEQIEGYYECFTDLSEDEKKDVVSIGYEAREMGLTPMNPSWCCPEHIYCNTIGKEMLVEKK